MVGHRRNPASGKTGLPKIAAQRDFWEEERQAQRAGRQAKRAVCHGALPATSRRSVASLRANSRGIAAPVRALATSHTKKRDTRQVSLFLVGMVGLEPMTSCMSSMRSNQLSYTPVTAFISYHFSMCFVKQKYGAFRIFSKSGQSRRKRYARRKRKFGFSVGARRGYIILCTAGLYHPMHGGAISSYARRGYIILCAAGLYHQTISFHIK